MNSRFSWQKFISIGLLFSFIIMMISGVILYIAPEGSLSRWIGWDVFKLTKTQWEQQHTLFSYIFIVFSILHILLINWDLLISYFTNGKFSFASYKELIIAVLITVWVFTGTLANIQPFKFILQLGDDISNSYSEQVVMPTVSDAEKLTLKEFSIQVYDIEYIEVKKILEKLNFSYITEDAVILDFCHKNAISPEELYQIINGQLMRESEMNED